MTDTKELIARLRAMDYGTVTAVKAANALEAAAAENARLQDKLKSQEIAARVICEHLAATRETRDRLAAELAVFKESSNDKR